jgi:hypothetical protein
LGEILLFYLTPKNRENFGEISFFIVIFSKFSIFLENFASQNFQYQKKWEKKNPSAHNLLSLAQFT